MSILKNLYNNIFNRQSKLKTHVKIENADVRAFNEKLIEISNPNDNLYDYPYWYSFIKSRALSSISKSHDNKKDEYESNVYGHADEYSKRLINETVEDKTRFIKPRIICYGKIYEMLLELKINIQNNNSNDLNFCFLLPFLTMLLP